MYENPAAVRSKNSIEAALLSLMREQPYRAITIRAITERASLSRQTFYLHYSDKDAVLSRHMLRVFEGIMQRVRVQRVETVFELVQTYTEIVAENAAFFRILADNGLTGLVCRVYREHLDAMPPVLECQRENRSEAERRYCNAFWVAAFVEVYALWLAEDMQTPRAEIERTITDIMLGVYFRPWDGEQNT